MRRALQLAAYGSGHVSPNPRVGAVIVADGKIIGEGWHRRYGSGHAEVNAVASVADKAKLRGATVYVTLEPCSHYGKTPPCSKLLIDSEVGRVVVGVRDPFREVSGRGIAMLRDAGIEVTEGVLEDECRELNLEFMTAHTLRRPFVRLKWAQSADGFISPLDSGGNPCRAAISNPLTQMLVHKGRTMTDAIMVGTNTANVDDPRLTSRLWPGNDPLKITFDLHGNLDPSAFIASDSSSLIIRREKPLPEILADLYASRGITSLVVEGGRKLLDSFIASGLYDEVRVETGCVKFGHGLPAPAVPGGLRRVSSYRCRGSVVEIYRR